MIWIQLVSRDGFEFSKRRAPKMRRETREKHNMQGIGTDRTKTNERKTRNPDQMEIKNWNRI